MNNNVFIINFQIYFFDAQFSFCFFLFAWMILLIAFVINQGCDSNFSILII